MKQPPPPSYQAAMEAQLPAYPDTVAIVSLAPQREDLPVYGYGICHEHAIQEVPDATVIVVPDESQPQQQQQQEESENGLKDEACAEVKVEEVEAKKEVELKKDDTKNDSVEKKE